jgi:hypothetical protein
MLFLLLLIYILIAHSPKKNIGSAIYGFVCGTIGTLVILTNWRIMPTSIAIVVFLPLLYNSTPKNFWKNTIPYLICCMISSIAIFVLILYYQFGFDFSLYYKHFFGFASKAAGWASGPYNGSATSFIWFLFNPKAALLLPVLTMYILIPEKNKITNKIWALVMSFIFISCLAAYYLNYYGGGMWYFIPFLVVLWLFYCTNYTQMPKARLSLLGTVLLALLCANVRSVLVPTLKRVIRMDRAYSFMTTIRSLQEISTIVSEDTYLFRTSYDGELIDMGDTVSVLSKSGYYGKEFNETVERHFRRILNYPPDYIVTGFTESPELKKVIEESYVLVAEGPGNLTANYGNNSRLFKRKNSISP